MLALFLQPKVSYLLRIAQFSRFVWKIEFFLRRANLVRRGGRMQVTLLTEAELDLISDFWGSFKEIYYPISSRW